MAAVASGVCWASFLEYYKWSSQKSNWCIKIRVPVFGTDSSQTILAQILVHVCDSYPLKMHHIWISIMDDIQKNKLFLGPNGTHSTHQNRNFIVEVGRCLSVSLCYCGPVVLN